MATKEEKKVLGLIRDTQIRMEERQINIERSVNKSHDRIDDVEIRVDNVEGHVGILKNNWKWLGGILTVGVTIALALAGFNVI